MKTHQGRLAVITGAARGIGQAVCRLMSERGATVVGTDVTDLSETAKLVESCGGAWLGVPCDVSSSTDVDALASTLDRKYGRCDILVNNAGIFPTCALEQLDLELWRKVLSVNLDGAFMMCKALFPLMKRNNWGRIVNIVSSSVEVSGPGLAAYKASKLGLVGLTRGIATDVAPYGICVNAVSPGFTRTPGNMARGPHISERLVDAVARQAIKKIAEPEDVVPTILFLTSDDAGFVTGQTIYADGGLHFH